MKLRNYVLNLSSGLGQNAVAVPLKLMDGDVPIGSVDTAGVDEAGQWEYEVNGSPGRMYALVSHGSQSRRIYSDVSLGRWGGWTDAEFYEFFGTFGSGVVSNIGDELVPVAAGLDATFTVGTGLYLIDASPFRIYEPEVITVAPNATGGNRTDVVVVRKTRTGVDIWKTELVIKTGSVVVTQDDDTWEEEIFRVTVANGFTVVSGGAIADNRTYVDVTPPSGLDAGATTTRTVAASDSSGLAVVIADYVCDGTNDEVQLEAAAQADGRVYCFNGTYYLDAVANLASCHSFEGESEVGVIFTVNNVTAGFATDNVAVGHRTFFSNFTVTAGSQDDLAIDARGYLDSSWSNITIEGFNRGIHLGGSSGTYTAGSTRNRVSLHMIDCLVNVYIDGSSGDRFTVEESRIILRNDLSGIGVDLVTGQLDLVRTQLGEAFNANGVVIRAGAGQFRAIENDLEWTSQKSDRYPFTIFAGATGQAFIGNRYSAGCTKPHINDLNAASGRYVQLDANQKNVTYPDGFVELNTDLLVGKTSTFTGAIVANSTATFNDDVTFNEPATFVDPVTFTAQPVFDTGIRIAETSTAAFEVRDGVSSTNLFLVDTDTNEGVVAVGGGADLVSLNGANTWMLIDGLLGHAHFYRELRLPGSSAIFSVTSSDGATQYIKASSSTGLQLGQGADLSIYSAAIGGTLTGSLDQDGNFLVKSSLKVESTNVRALSSARGANTSDLVFAVDNTNEVVLLSNGADLCMYSDDLVSKTFEVDGATGDTSIWGSVDLGTNYTNQHLIRGQVRFGGNMPTITAGAAAGTGPSFSRVGNDTAGRVVMTSGTSTTTGIVWTFTWAVPRPTENYVVMIYAADTTTAAAVASFYVDQSVQSANEAMVKARVAPTASSSHHFWYLVFDFA